MARHSLPQGNWLSGIPTKEGSSFSLMVSATQASQVRFLLPLLLAVSNWIAQFQQVTDL